MLVSSSGEKLGKILALFPTMYLSGGTCVTLIMIGGSSMKIFYKLICNSNVNQPLTTVEWYIVFTVSAVILAQLPNLNSIAGVSLIGAVTAVSYCTLTWVVSVVHERPRDVSYDPVMAGKSDQIGSVCSILNALGIIAFAFRGHNLILEIQVWKTHFIILLIICYIIKHIPSKIMIIYIYYRIECLAYGTSFIIDVVK